jgi:mono/diheme cytochrome c family protein
LRPAGVAALIGLLAWLSAASSLLAHEMTVRGTVAAIEPDRIQIKTGQEKVGEQPAWFPIDRSTTIRGTANPVPATREGLAAALEHFADHCAICHDNNGSGDTEIGRSVFPPAPDLRAAPTQKLTDGELFYAIEQGIPWTAMPAWSNGTPEGERQSWELVRFIRHLPSLTEDEISRMEQFNPRSEIAKSRNSFGVEARPRKAGNRLSGR